MEDGKGGSPHVSCAESPMRGHRWSRWRKVWCWIRRGREKTARTWSGRHVAHAPVTACQGLRWPGLPATTTDLALCSLLWVFAFLYYSRIGAILSQFCKYKETKNYFTVSINICKLYVNFRMRLLVLLLRDIKTERKHIDETAKF